MVFLTVAVPHLYMALFLQVLVILVFLGIFLLSGGLLRKFRVHHISYSYQHSSGRGTKFGDF